MFNKIIKSAVYFFIICIATQSIAKTHSHQKSHTTRKEYIDPCTTTEQPQLDKNCPSGEKLDNKMSESNYKTYFSKYNPLNIIYTFYEKISGWGILARAIFGGIMGSSIVSFYYFVKNLISNGYNNHEDHVNMNENGPNEENTPPSSCENWFEILSVSENATFDEIKSAYRKKIAEFHPDKVSTLSPEFRKMAEEKSKIINEAYSTAKSLRL